MEASILVSIGRWILPIIAFYVIIGCGVSLVRGNKKTGTIGYLINSANGDEIPLISYETSIGRSNSCDIVLAYTTVSRFHAVIAKRGGKWILFDTNSRTGTYINDKRIIRQGIVENGDNLVFGNAIFRFYEHRPHHAPSADAEEIIVPLFPGDDKFHTGEIYLPTEIQTGCSLKNCITGEIMSIDDMDSVLFGRSDEAHIHISSPAVSRHHALMSRSDGNWIIEDLNSTAGTILNGSPVSACTKLTDGDIIEICGFTVRFCDED